MRVFELQSNTTSHYVRVHDNGPYRELTIRTYHGRAHDAFAGMQLAEAIARHEGVCLPWTERDPDVINIHYDTTTRPIPGATAMVYNYHCEIAVSVTIWNPTTDPYQLQEQDRWLRFSASHSIPILSSSAIPG